MANRTRAPRPERIRSCARVSAWAARKRSGSVTRSGPAMTVADVMNSPYCCHVRYRAWQSTHPGGVNEAGRITVTVQGSPKLDPDARVLDQEARRASRRSEMLSSPIAPNLVSALPCASMNTNDGWLFTPKVLHISPDSSYT